MGRLAAAIIQQAFMDLSLTVNPSDSFSVRRAKHQDRAEAMAWLTDTTSEDPHSLRQQCLIMSLTLGADICPLRISEAARQGRRFSIKPYKQSVSRNRTVLERRRRA